MPSLCREKVSWENVSPLDASKSVSVPERSCDGAWPVICPSRSIGSFQPSPCAISTRAVSAVPTPLAGTAVSSSTPELVRRRQAKIVRGKQFERFPVPHRRLWVHDAKGEREVVDRLNAVFVDGEAALDGLRVLQGFFPGQVAPARIVVGLVVGFMRRRIPAGGAGARGSSGVSGDPSALGASGSGASSGRGASFAGSGDSSAASGSGAASRRGSQGARRAGGAPSAGRGSAGAPESVSWSFLLSVRSRGRVSC